MSHSKREFVDQVGYLTFAQNTEVNYLRLAYIQALSLKVYMPESKYAVVIDTNTQDWMLPKYAEAFDYVIVLKQDLAVNQDLKFNNECQTFSLTPFKETIKLESDLIFTRDISHWIHGLRSKEIFLTTNIVNYRNEDVIDTTYRKQFIDNGLPNVYNGFSYFRYTKTAAEFFRLCRYITENWDYVRNNILKGQFTQLTTDIMYALAAKLIGEENVTNPALIYPKFVHMKGSVNGLAANSDWSKHLYSQLDNEQLLVGFVKQQYPFHYHIKTWATEEMENKYERLFKRIS